jgi:2-hydroxy-3-keto-5-methylthiopentenyl-1-phosphate phosphatase
MGTGKENLQNLQIYCDFDGTITEKDMIITLMEQFAPQGWEAIKDAVLSRTISVQEGVGRMFAMIPSDQIQEMVEYARRIVQIRPGFAEFMDYVRRSSLEFYVTSGGMDFFVYPILAPWVPKEQIYCNRVDSTGPFIRIQWPHDCDAQCSGGCGCCKPSIMRQTRRPGCKQIVIGDSVTDAKAAKEADLVIARGYLVDICEQEHIPYRVFRDFYDVRNILEELRQEER